jgi:hypothetical protein
MILGQDVMGQLVEGSNHEARQLCLLLAVVTIGSLVWALADGTRYFSEFDLDTQGMPCFGTQHLHHHAS